MFFAEDKVSFIALFEKHPSVCKEKCNSQEAITALAVTRTTCSLQARSGRSPERSTMARPRVAPASIPVALPHPLRLRASLTASRRNLLANQQPATRMPNGLTSEMPSTTQPWLHSAKKEHKNADWFKAWWEEMQPVTEAKRKAMLAHKQNPSPSTRNALRAARSKAQQTARRCANEY